MRMIAYIAILKYANDDKGIAYDTYVTGGVGMKSNMFVDVYRKSLDVMVTRICATNRPEDIHAFIQYAESMEKIFPSTDPIITELRGAVQHLQACTRNLDSR